MLDLQNFTQIPPQEFKDLIYSLNPIILDVRTQEEFGPGHIPNAINLDFYADNFISQLDELDKEKIYLVYCHAGHRSFETLMEMRELQFQNVIGLDGGIADWQFELE